MVRGSPNPRHLGLPARLRKARKQSELTHLALAKKAGVSEATALYVQKGQQLPTVGTIARLASALSVSAAWLAFGLGDIDSESPAATCKDMGARLQEVRVERGHTKASLGRDADLNPGTIGGIENGGQAGVETIEALAKTLNISPAWLAFATGPRVLPKRHRVTKPPEPAHP